MRKNKKSNAILLSFFLFGIGNTSFGQLQQGAWMLGANGRISGGKNALNLLAEGKLSYFVRPKLEFGLVYSYGQSRYKNANFNFNTKHFGIEHFARYYFLKPESNINIFAQAGIRTGLRFSNMSYNPMIYFETNLGGGVIYFLTPRLSLEAKVAFQPRYSPNSSSMGLPFNTTIGINFRLGK